MTISIIVAVANNRVIGVDGHLPWRLPADMKRFVATTMGKPVVMGRKTFEEFNKPLKGRANIVVSGKNDFQPEGVTVVPTLAEGLKLAETIAGANEEDEVMVIGGARIYEEALPKTDRIYLTEVDGDFEGDTFFPDLADGQWNEVSRENCESDEPGAPAYSFVVLERA